jgi:hypothetical protein
VGLHLAQTRDGIGFRHRDVGLSQNAISQNIGNLEREETYVLPTGRSSTLAMLDQQMTRANLLLSISAILSSARLRLRSKLLLLPLVALLGTGKSVHLLR